MMPKCWQHRSDCTCMFHIDHVIGTFSRADLQARGPSVTITVNVPMYYNVSDRQEMVVLSVLFTCVCV